MSDFITLDRKSPEFDSYLRGTFSKEKRALPIKSLNVNSEQESVTFQIVPLSEINRPHFIVVWLKALRVRSFLTVLFPMFLILSKNMIDDTIKDPWTLLLATLGVMVLFASVNLRNDFIDHMKGFDRIDGQLGSRPIQNGWITAESVRKLANRLLFLSILLAFPIIIAFPFSILFMALAGLVGYLMLYRLRFTFKELAGGEFGLMLLVGPLLACGYEISIAGLVRPDTLFLGFVWGWMALLPIHVRNLELIVSQSQAGVSNLVTYFGFDKGKKFIYYWWYLAVVFFIAYHFMYAGFYWFWFLSLLIVFLSIKFSHHLMALTSPVGSAMQSLRQKCSYLLNAVIFLWIFEITWNMFL